MLRCVDLCCCIHLRSYRDDAGALVARFLALAVRGVEGRVATALAPFDADTVADYNAHAAEVRDAAVCVPLAAGEDTKGRWSKHQTSVYSLLIVLIN